MTRVSRRQALGGLAVMGIGAAHFRTVVSAQTPAPQPELNWPQPATGITPAFPTTEAFLAREVVGASHANLNRVKELVSRQPALAEASWDWGFGDWETALGAASHVGNRPIAEFLLEHGAAPTIFSATMLGHLDVVKAMIAAKPGLQRIRGPHSLTLLSHARAGGPASAPVVAYLESLGGANDPLPAQPVTAEQRAALVGRYAFGKGPRDVFVVEDVREVLGVTRVGASRRNLVHVGDWGFVPVGAEAVRVRFTMAGGRVEGMTIADPDVVLTATRERG